MTAIYIIIGLVAGIIIGLLAAKVAGSRQNVTQATAIAGLEAKIQSLETERSRIQKEASDRIAEERQHGRDALERQAAQQDKFWQARFDQMKEELQNVTNEALSAKQQTLQDTNRQQIGELLDPIREQFDTFRKSVEATRTQSEVAKRELKDSFEHTMKLFQQMQLSTVAALKEETARIGSEAANLTQALKRDTKKQGDWGEMILESLLESSGLERDRHYFVQENVKGEDSRNLRPDVIVRFPEGRSVIIDSKVSLTAYVEAFETEDSALKERRLKDHARSVRRHVDELSAKKYDTLVSDAIGFVLMFIPNDQCYLSALEQERDLGRYAFSKGVVIISPSNLMIALQLAYNLWQQDARNKNIDKIVQTASDLYDKVAGFSSTMESVEKSIGKLADDFANAKKQLYEGKGNIMGRIENLKKLGITPKKQIKTIPD